MAVRPTSTNKSTPHKSDCLKTCHGSYARLSACSDGLRFFFGGFRALGLGLACNVELPEICHEAKLM